MRHKAFSSLLLIPLVSAACVAPSAVGPSSSAGSLPTAIPTQNEPSPTQCFDATLFLEYPAPTMANARDGVPTVVVGTFDGYGEAQWETKDGERPRGNPMESNLVTEVRIGVQQIVRGNEQDAGAAAVLGGKLGCDSVQSDRDLGLHVGDRYAFFLAPLEYRHLNIMFAWPVTDEGMVETPLEGIHPLEDLNKDIPPPTPWPTVEATAGP